jgi:hypothetical protein
MDNSKWEWVDFSKTMQAISKKKSKIINVTKTNV